MWSLTKPGGDEGIWCEIERAPGAPSVGVTSWWSVRVYGGRTIPFALTRSQADAVVLAELLLSSVLREAQAHRRAATARKEG